MCSVGLNSENMCARQLLKHRKKTGRDNAPAKFTNINVSKPCVLSVNVELQMLARWRERRDPHDLRSLRTKQNRSFQPARRMTDKNSNFEAVEVTKKSGFYRGASHPAREMPRKRRIIAPAADGLPLQPLPTRHCPGRPRAPPTGAAVAGGHVRPSPGFCASSPVD